MVNATPKKTVRLNRVIVRFAGDSGDGMQLTGDRFTWESAALGNDLSTLPGLPRRDPGASRAHSRGLRLPAALRRSRHHDPGRRAQRAGGHEPRRAEGQPPLTLAAGRRSSSTPTSSPSATSPRSGYDQNPLDDGTLPTSRVHPVGLTSLTVEALAGSGLSKQGRRAGEEHVRAGPALLALPPPIRGHGRASSTRSSRASRRSSRPTSPPARRLQLRRDHRGLRGPLRGRAGADAARHATATSAATWPWPTGCSPPPIRRVCRCSSGRTRSPRPATSSTS